MALPTPISIRYPRIDTQGSKVVRILISASACQSPRVSQLQQP